MQGDGVTTGAGASLRPGSVVGRFALTREIGRGGMCLVFEGRHVDLDMRVAVKMLLPQFANQPAVVERFLREGRAASRITHRNAIRMVDVGQSDGVVYLAMEFLDGEDLAARIKRGGALSWQAAVDLLLPVLSALAEAHEAGVIHRDIKPANIFLAVDRYGAVEPKVLDFGISKIEGDDQGQTGTEMLLGTPYYMAPEQIRSAKNTTAASDQYALGVMLYQCVTGQVPFRGENAFNTFQLITAGQYTQARALVPALPPALDAALQRAMAVNPADRFPAVVAFGAALLPFASDGARALHGPRFAAALDEFARSSPGLHTLLSGSSPDLRGPAMHASLVPNPGTITQATGERQAPAPAPSPRRGWVLAAAAVAVVGLAATAGRFTREPAVPAAPAATTRRITASTTPPTPVAVPPAPTPVAAPLPAREAPAPPSEAPERTQRLVDAGLAHREERPLRPRRTPNVVGSPAVAPAQLAAPETSRDQSGASIIR
ncbi:MAG: serine/threonine-protein kinase [Polyangiales bacterium]